jgi:ectoine hydroxylase-related dioxygenase (phytanoyl-CoA dioxygenase family)
MTASNIAQIVESLETCGYAVIPDVLSPQTCRTLIGKLEDAHQIYQPHYARNKANIHQLNDNADEKLVYNLHNKDRAFLPLIDDPAILDPVEQYLQAGSYNNSDPIVLRQVTGRSPAPGGPTQQLHIDSRVPGLPFALMVVATYILEDFTAPNGATRIVPGSHRWPSYPEDGAQHPDEITSTAPAGSVLLMDGGVWHAGGSNQTEDTRWAILLTYVRWFFKTAFDFNQNTPRHIFEDMSERQKELMGFCSNPPQDEFTRVNARTSEPDTPLEYQLPAPTKAP